MRFSCVLLVSGVLFAQSPAAQKPASDSAVVATVGGKGYTAAEVLEILNSVPQQFRQNALADKRNALQQVLMQKYLASEAKKQGLENQSPYKEQIEFFLAQSEINDYSNKIVIRDEEAEKYYKAHPDEFQQAKVRMIQIAFSTGQVKSDVKVRSEAEAKAKAEELRKQIVGGADFADLARQNSDDKESADKGGEWGFIKRNSKLPDDIKNAIFALKPGQVSEPLRQPNGFYLVKLEDLSVEPLNEVSAKIDEMLKQQRFQAWMESVQKRFEIKVEDPDFFKNKSAVPSASR
jgi:parvulin-like peptidyl-prolyl isomerase